MNSLVVRLVGIIVVFLYCGTGIFIFFSNEILVIMNPNYKKALGAIVFFYGIFRAFRLYNKHKLNEEDENQD